MNAKLIFPLLLCVAMPFIGVANAIFNEDSCRQFNGVCRLERYCFAALPKGYEYKCPLQSGLGAVCCPTDLHNQMRPCPLELARCVNQSAYPNNYCHPVQGICNDGLQCCATEL